MTFVFLVCFLSQDVFVFSLKISYQFFPLPNCLLVSFLLYLLLYSHLVFKIYIVLLLYSHISYSWHKVLALARCYFSESLSFCIFSNCQENLVFKVLPLQHVDSQLKSIYLYLHLVCNSWPLIIPTVSQYVCL